jgi:hypothetical protein
MLRIFGRSVFEIQFIAGVIRCLKFNVGCRPHYSIPRHVIPRHPAPPQALGAAKKSALMLPQRAARYRRLEGTGRRTIG